VGGAWRPLQPPITETTSIHWVLVGMTNRTLGPYLAAIHRTLLQRNMSGMLLSAVSGAMGSSTRIAASTTSAAAI
jgi:hypothetical protein